MTVLRIKSSLHRRPESANLFFRKVIPVELRPYFGKREIKYSFQTADPVTARSRYHQISAYVERQIANARAQLLGIEEITDLQLQKLADEWHSLTQVRADSDAPLSPLFLHQLPGRPRKSPSFLNLDFCPQANNLEKLEKALGMDARALLLHHGIALNLKSAQYHKLLVLLAERAILIEGRDPVESHLLSATVGSTETPTLKDIWNRFEALYSASDNPKDRGKVETYRSDFSKLIQHAGDIRLSMLTREHALTFRDALRELPDTTSPNFEQRTGIKPKEFRQLPLERQRDIASEENLPGRTTSGVKAALKRVAAVLAFADQELQTKFNAFNPIPTVPNTQTQHRGEAFEYSKEEIETLLTSDSVLSSLTVDELWATLTLYLTGARLREIAPMLGEDLVMVRDTTALHIREDHSMGRTVKNYSSIRRIPVHPYLMELGFTEYTLQIPQTKSVRLPRYQEK